GPSGVAAVNPQAGTAALPATQIQVEANPSDAPAATATGVGPPTGPTMPGIHIGGAPTPCSVFPFGIPCWLAHQLGQLNASAVAPSFSIGLPSVFGSGASQLNVNLDHPFGADLGGIMAVVRPVLLFLALLGITLWLGGMAMGGSTGGGGTAEA